MPETSMRNPHAEPAASIAATRHIEGCAVRAAAKPDGSEALWPLRLGRAWPGIVRAMHAPRHARQDVNGSFGGAVAAESLLDAGAWPASWPRVVVARAMVAEGPAWDAMRRLEAEGRIGLRALAVWERAMLERSAAPDAGSYLARFISASQRKSLGRKRRRIEEESGALALTIADAPDAAAAAFEIFLRLEASGWKGRTGTALARRPADRAYVEDVMLAMAASGQAFAAVLRAGAEPIAAGLLLRAGGEAVFWKTAYDERRARFSPGVLLDVMLTEWLYTQPWFERLDAGHDDSVDPDTLIWKQRRRMADVVIDLAPGSWRGRLALAGLRLREALRGLKRRYAAKYSRSASA